MNKVMHTNALQYFQIAVTDFERAKTFYSKIFDYEMPEVEVQGIKLGMFLCDHEKGGVGGAIGAGNSAKPSKDGTIVFLHAGPDLGVVLERVPENGGTIVQPKSPLGPGSFFAIFDDTEGNRVGLYSPE